MKLFIFILLLSFQAAADSFGTSCPPGMFVQYNQGMGAQCVQNYWTDASVIQGCFGGIPGAPVQNNWFTNFPAPVYQPQAQPWWAYQGNMYYPNMNYPGPWRYPGIQQHYYPGQGQVFAAKPNVYVDSIHDTEKFSFKFISKEKPQFLATTPVLDKSLAWSGSIEKDKFLVDNIYYDYLFYDLRLPLEKMQFEAGLCSSKDEAIEWMLKDLKEMGHSMVSLQDFEEHWRVKIPNYPYYCLYPQYNDQLDPLIPIEIPVSQSKFHRSLYVLLPYESAPSPESNPYEIALPVKDPKSIRPDTRVKREVEFREWGVAFIGL